LLHLSFRYELFSLTDFLLIVSELKQQRL